MKDIETILLRIGCAFAAGIILGLERERNGHAAGLRTTILVCLAPTLAVLACGAMTEPTTLGRVTQGLFAGVGFIGGGVILKHDETGTIRGVTTAAVLWMATTLGFAFGLGYYLLGFLGLAVSVIIVYVLHPVSRRLHTRRFATLCITTAKGAITAKQGAELLDKLGLHVYATAFDFNSESNVYTIRLSLTYSCRDALDLPALVHATFTPIPGVTQIRWY